jgi:hypothetical protein
MNLKLTSDDTVLDAEKLGLVVARDCGVRVLISWQERQVLWHFCCCHD